MDNPKDRLIINQQKQIRALQAQVAEVANDNIYLKKVLSIALRDNLGGAPVVVNRDRLAEATTEFDLDRNMGGDILVRVRAVYK
ncbi:MAG TPA: hypothetical protein PK114_00085 [Smithellaceae bacterium]|nr:hypothetical protein [Smithellaceae bacterium]